MQTGLRVAPNPLTEADLNIIGDAVAKGGSLTNSEARRLLTHIASVDLVLKDSRQQFTEVYGKLAVLTEAVRKLYYAAKWAPDRPIDEDEDVLWLKLRDAAGFEPGHSPRSIPEYKKIDVGSRVKVIGPNASPDSVLFREHQGGFGTVIEKSDNPAFGFKVRFDAHPTYKWWYKSTNLQLVDETQAVA